MSTPTPTTEPRQPVGTDNEASRHRWVREHLAQLPAGGRILDAGAGTQRYRDACQHLHYVSQDFAAYDGAGDGHGLQTGTFDYGRLDLVCDITCIPEPDAAFDAVLCTEVLEHVPSPEAALQELVRLLKPGGDLLLTAPFVSFTHFAPYHFCTGFSRYYYRHHLKARGMEVIEITANGDFFELVAQENRRIEAMARQYAQERLRFYERFALRLVQRALTRFRNRARNAAEFACFGLHVHARKPGGSR